MKHFVFIINPRSGTDRVKEIEGIIAQAFSGKDLSYEIQFTKRAQHGIELAREAANSGAYCVVAVGGDGSVADVAQGLLGMETVLGIIPKGSGNGLARTLKIPLNTAGAVQVLTATKGFTMDVGYANEKLFLSNAGVGFDTVVAKAFQMSIRRGLASYASLVMTHLWQYRAMNYRITLDGQEIEERAFLLTVANGSQFGYNFRIAPEALLDDGLLDVIIVKPFPHVLGASIALRAFNGSILKSPYVRHYKAREISIHHPNLRLMQTDGDPQPCDSTLHIRLQAAAMKVLVP